MKKICAVFIALFLFLTACGQEQTDQETQSYTDLSFLPRERQKHMTESEPYLNLLYSSTGALAHQYYGLETEADGSYKTVDNNIDAPGLYLITQTPAKDVTEHMNTMFTPDMTAALFSLYFTDYYGMAGIIDRSAGHGFTDYASLYTVHVNNSKTVEYTEERFYFLQHPDETDEEYASRIRRCENHVHKTTINVILRRSLLSWRIEKYERG